MRLGRFVTVCLAVLMLSVGAVAAQDSVPTLIPPTLVPSQTAGEAALISESAIAQIQRDGQVRVGILYNEPPFGELNIRGEVVGFDATLGRAFAELWGVNAVFVQVTRQNAFQKLIGNEVDLLLAAQVHYRGQDARVEYSQSYYRGGQAMMVRLDDPAQTLAEMNNRRVGVVMGTAAVQAISEWQRRGRVNIVVQQYISLDEAIVGLVNNEVDGIVDKRYPLRERILPDRVRVLDDTVQPEPYAVVMRRQDVNLRNLVNRSLQYLAQSGRLAQIHEEFFPGRAYPLDTVPIWSNLGESAPTPANFGADIPYPSEYAFPRVRASGVVRVAGVPQPLPQAPESDRRLAAVNQQLAEALAARWGVRVEFIPGTESDPVGAVQRGQADLALGVRPDWNSTDRVDFAGVYMLRGKRLIVPANRDITSLADLRGDWIGVFAVEPESAAMVTALAESVNARASIYTIGREEDAAFVMLTEENADAVFGDSLRLLPHVEANPTTLKFAERCANCDVWYTRDYLGVAVPRNDIDFRLLVEYTLQELALDGTLNALLIPVTVQGSALTIEAVPGSSEYLGLSLIAR